MYIYLGHDSIPIQKLEIEHKKTTNQVVENTIEKKDRREGKGRVLAISRNVYRLQNSDVYYVESETSNSVYFVKFKPDVFESWYCSCKDNSTRHLKCKHIFAIEFAIKWGTIKDIDKPSLEVNKRFPAVIQQPNKSYLEDNYDF